MSEQKPSIGRVVHVKVPGFNDFPCVGVITRVWTDECVNVRLIQDPGTPEVLNGGQTSVMRFDGELTACGLPNADEVGGDQWAWWWPPRV